MTSLTQIAREDESAQHIASTLEQLPDVVRTEIRGSLQLHTETITITANLNKSDTGPRFVVSISNFLNTKRSAHIKLIRGDGRQQFPRFVTYGAQPLVENDDEDLACAIDYLERSRMASSY